MKKREAEMFLVSDTRSLRTKKIRAYMQSDVAVAVLLSAADFEWTCRRCILAMGISPTKQMKETGGVFQKYFGLDGYKDAWKQEVFPLFGKTLVQVIPNWDFFKCKAYPVRHRLIHGAVGAVGVEYGQRAVDSILAASEALTEFAEQCNAPIYGRKIVRRKQREHL